MVGNLHDHRHVVFNQQDRCAGVVADRAEQFVERQRLARVEAGGRLVQAQELRPRAHGAGNLQTALRAVGKVAGRIVRAVDQVRLLEPVLGEFDRFGVRTAIAAETEKAEDRVAGGPHQHVVLRHQEVLQHRQTRKHADVLEGAGDLGVAGDLEVGHAFQQELLARLLRHRDHAHRRLVEAGDAIEHGRLAGPVRADEGGDVATPGLEGQIVDRHQAAEAHRQMLDFEDWFVVHRVRLEGGHQPCPSLVKLPDTALRSCRKAVGSRLPTNPRGFQTITTTIARPKISMR